MKYNFVVRICWLQDEFMGKVVKLCYCVSQILCGIYCKNIWQVFNFKCYGVELWNLILFVICGQVVILFYIDVFIVYFGFVGVIVVKLCELGVICGKIVIIFYGIDIFSWEVFNYYIFEY